MTRRSVPIFLPGVMAAALMAVGLPGAEAGFLRGPLLLCDQGSFFVGGIPKITKFSSSVTPATAYGQITVGQALRLSGPRLPAGLSREGIGAWLLKGLKIFRRGPVGMTALIAAGSFQDGRLDHRLGLYRCATDRRYVLSGPSEMSSPMRKRSSWLYGPRLRTPTASDGSTPPGVCR